MPLSFMYSLEEETYLYDINILLKTLLKSLTKICYCSFNKTGESLKILCKNEEIEVANLIIIDMISPKFRECKDTENIRYVNVDNLPQATKQIINIMESENCDAFILDSLSTMSIYYDDRQLLQFTHEILVYTESKHLISNLIIQRHDEKKDWMRAIIPLVGSPKEVKFS